MQGNILSSLHWVFSGVDYLCIDVYIHVDMWARCVFPGHRYLQVLYRLNLGEANEVCMYLYFIFQKGSQTHNSKRNCMFSLRVLACIHFCTTASEDDSR